MKFSRSACSSDDKISAYLKHGRLVTCALSPENAPLARPDVRQLPSGKIQAVVKAILDALKVKVLGFW